LKLYRLDNQRYPATEQGLNALVTKPLQPPIPPNWKPDGYLEKLPVDPWGRPYQYLNRPKGRGRRVHLRRRRPAGWQGFGRHYRVMGPLEAKVRRCPQVGAIRILGQPGDFIRRS